MRVKAKDANEEVIEIEEQDVASVELSDEELAALKKLLPVVDKLLALLKVEKEEHSTEFGDEDEDKDIEDSDEDEDKDKEVNDSLKSGGAMHNSCMN